MRIEIEPNRENPELFQPYCQPQMFIPVQCIAEGIYYSNAAVVLSVGQSVCACTVGPDSQETFQGTFKRKFPSNRSNQFEMSELHSLAENLREKACVKIHLV